MLLSEYYHECNALWRQFDALIDLHTCACVSAPKAKEHSQLLRLMQFLMDLNDVFSYVRTLILTIEPLPDVKSAFATLSRDDSYRSSNLTSKSAKSGPAAFAARPSSSLAGGFKKNNGGQNSANNASSNDFKADHNKSALHTLTNDQYQRLMTLLSDTGASQHIRTMEQVKQIGSYKLGNDLIIKDVLVVPGYHDLTQKFLMGTGSERGGLYFFDEDKRVNNSNIKTCQICTCVWHNRLGHPSDHVLTVLKDKIKDLSQPKSGPCEICHKAKQTREPFPLSVHKTKNLGDLVHLDVWGSYRVKSRDGHKYFLTMRLPTAVLSGKSPYDLRSDEPSDDGGDSAYSNTKFALKSSTESPHDSTIDEVKEGPLYATQTGVSEGIQGTAINDDDYESEGEDIDSFGQLFESPEPVVGQNVRRSSRKATMPSKYNDYGDKRVCKLVKSLYGLKHAPRKWNEKLTSVLVSNRKYCTKLLTEFGMLACKPCNTPIEVNPDNKKVVSKFGDDVPLIGITNYQKLVGKLIYLTMTRPDISYVVHCLNQVMHSPMQSHLRLVFRVLIYLKRELGLGITFKESNNSDLRVFADSD
ncbi:ribonuclease H-like domain-containing protein [Tanacetum coccineum]